MPTTSSRTGTTTTCAYETQIGVMPGGGQFVAPGLQSAGLRGGGGHLCCDQDVVDPRGARAQHLEDAVTLYAAKAIPIGTLSGSGQKFAVTGQLRLRGFGLHETTGSATATVDIYDGEDSGGHHHG